MVKRCSAFPYKYSNSTLLYIVVHMYTVCCIVCDKEPMATRVLWGVSINALAYELISIGYGYLELVRAPSVLCPVSCRQGNFYCTGNVNSVNCIPYPYNNWSKQYPVRITAILPEGREHSDRWLVRPGQACLIVHITLRR